MSKDYGTFTVKFWADGDEFAQEHGQSPANALEAARLDYTGMLDKDGVNDHWRGAEIVKPPRAFVMPEQYRRELMAKYDNWRAERTVLGFRSESMDDSPKDAQWEASDDGAVDLFGELASHLFDTDDCGHQEVTTVPGELGTEGVYVVECDNCPVKWTVKDGEVVPNA